MAYPIDLANVFPSDYHRRVLAHLPATEDDPTSTESLVYRILPDQEMEIDLPTLEVILGQLVASGDAEAVEGGGYRRTTEGTDKLVGPALFKKEVPNEETGEVETVLVEDPPKEGKPLARAEEANEELDSLDRELEQEAKANRKAELEKELKELED